MSEQFSKFVASERASIEAALRGSLPVSTLRGAGRLNEAIVYAVFPGGKRLRPALALLASGLAGASREQGLAVACAVEFLHSSSLILDDLPSMDDAVLRRKRRALHLVYGEGVAVLASVALLNQSYALFAEAARARGGRVADGAALVREAAACVGGLAETRTLAHFGECVGRAYQVCDDILDVTRPSEATGKPAGQDARHGRASTVEGLGAEGARALARHLITRGIARLYECFGARQEVGLLSDAALCVLDSAGAGRVTVETQEEAIA